MPASPLSHMAQRACVRNIWRIHDVGDLPYTVVRPVLLRITEPDYIRRIEGNCPHIYDADGEVWHALIKKTFSRWESKVEVPKHPSGWRDIYWTLRAEDDIVKAAAEQALGAKTDKWKADRAANTSKKVELNVVKVPKGLESTAEVIKLPKNSKFFAREQNTKDLKPEFVAWEKQHGPILGQGAHQYSRMKAADFERSTPGTKSKLAQFKKDARNMSRFPTNAQPKFVTSSNAKFNLPPPKVTAPPALLDRYRKPQPPKPVDPTPCLSEKLNLKKRKLERVQPPSSNDTLEQREKRLKSIAHPSATRHATTLLPKNTASSSSTTSHTTQRSESKHITTARPSILASSPTTSVSKKRMIDQVQSSTSDDTLERGEKRLKALAQTLSSQQPTVNQTSKPRDLLTSQIDANQQSKEKIVPSDSTNALEHGPQEVAALTKPPLSRQSSSPRPQFVRIPRLHHRQSSSTISDASTLSASISSAVPQSQATASDSSSVRPKCSSDQLREQVDPRSRTTSPLPRTPRRTKKAEVSCFMPVKKQRQKSF